VKQRCCLAGVALLFVTQPYALAGSAQNCLQLYYTKAYQQALPVCKRAAQAGNDQAQYVLGVMYNEGKGIAANSLQAEKWFKAASSRGHAAARYKLQSLVYDDVDTSEQHFTSKLWARHVPESDGIGSDEVEQSTADSHQEVDDYQKNNDLQQHVDSAIWLEPVPSRPVSNQTVSSQTVPSQTVLATLERAKPLADQAWHQTEVRENARPQYQGLNSEETAEISKALALDLAEENDNNNGNALRSDADMFRHYVQAVKQGDAHAQLMLALMYFEGRGVDKNNVRTIYLLNQAAKQGFAQAQYTLALLLHEGHNGIKRNAASAVRWFTHAANQGLVDAQYSLGLIYATSKSMKSDSKAVLWWQQAAAQQHAQAEHNLAVMYLKGRGVAENRSEAVRWFEQAAKRGDPVAQFNLAQLYSEGKWLDKNGRLAADWFYRAGASYLARGQKDEAMQAANKIEQLGSQQDLDVPNIFLADVLNKQIQEVDSKL